jgi:hypothetical protein
MAFTLQRGRDVAPIEWTCGAPPADCEIVHMALKCPPRQRRWCRETVRKPLAAVAQGLPLIGP